MRRRSYVAFALALAFALAVAIGVGAVHLIRLNPPPLGTVRPGDPVTVGKVDLAYGSWTTTETIKGPKKDLPARDGAVWVIVTSQVGLHDDAVIREAACEATLVSRGERWRATREPLSALDLKNVTTDCNRTQEGKAATPGWRGEVTFYFHVPADRVDDAIVVVDFYATGDEVVIDR
ncbi:MAG TPA: hypothetical protein PKM36_08795 [Propionibacteriaceae bacterium]|nr:hypothetical protein [Propionibacteriaceae bacterium]